MTSHAEHPDHSAHSHAHSPALADLLDLDAEVSGNHLSAVLDWLGRQAPEHPHRILDLGAGTGTGTLALAERFPGSDVYAVDVSDEMLARIRAKASAAGADDRIHTVHADLDSPWPELGPIDVVWVAMVLHEFSRPDEVLANALAALAPGGVIGIVEMDTPPTFLPDNLGASGLEARILDALGGQHAWQHPDWSDALIAAGFADVRKRTFTIDVPPGHSMSAGHYADTYLRSLRPTLEGKLPTEDLAILDTLLSDDDPRSLIRRDDLHIRGARTAWVGHRPR